MEFRRLLFAAPLAASIACGDDPTADQALATTQEPSSTEPSSSSGEEPSAPSPRADLGVAPPSACVETCNVLSQCAGQGQGDCLLACTASYDERAAIDGTCPDDHEELLACISALDCADVTAHLSGPAEGPCAEPYNTAELQCSLGDEQPSMACTALCTTVSECGIQSEAACQAACSQALATATEVSSACADAQEALIECTSGLSCDEYDAWAERFVDYPCQTADEAVEAACTGVSP